MRGRIRLEIRNQLPLRVRGTGVRAALGGVPRRLGWARAARLGDRGGHLYGPHGTELPDGGRWRALHLLRLYGTYQ